MRVLVNMDGNEPWGSVKGLEFLDRLSYYQFLKKNFFREVIAHRALAY
jgi:hypothetical protein